MGDRNDATVRPVAEELTERGSVDSGRRRAMTTGVIALGVAAGILAPRRVADASGPGTFDSATGDPAVRGDNFDGGPGVLGTSATGPGVRGESAGWAGAAGFNTSGNGGAGVFGTSATGPGLRGESTGWAGAAGFHTGPGGGAGVYGRSETGPGVTGQSVAGPGVGADSSTENPAIQGVNTYLASDGSGGPGVFGRSTNDNGVFGRSVNATGVRGLHSSPDPNFPGAGVVGLNSGVGPGVVGRAGSGAGVIGTAPGANPGVLARSGSQPGGGGLTLDGALALLALGHTVLRPPNTSDGPVPDSLPTGPTLEVVGGIRTDALFAPIGTGVIAKGAGIHQVVDTAAGPLSHISAALVGAPSKSAGSNNNDQSKIAISWIERAAGSFKIHLTGPVDVETPFTYTVVNP